MAKKYLIILLPIVFTFLFSGQFVSARSPEEITDWYIKNFETNIVVNKDSSLLITENITADCGDLLNKHGIFRVLPYQVNTDNGAFKTPIHLISITDFNGVPYKYKTIKEGGYYTITWKIGDPKVTVRGVNNYRITYRVDGAIRFGSPDFDELYWNLLGAFWEIDTDNFFAVINLPQEMSKEKIRMDYFTGFWGEKSKDLASYSWINDNTLKFISLKPLLAGQSITAAFAFPKGFFILPPPTFFEKYEWYFKNIHYLLFLIPVLVFIICYRKWRKYGDDPKMKSPIPPEFGVPDNITPIQMGMILNSGRWNDRFFTATIINLAVKKTMTIEEVEGSNGDYYFIKNNNGLVFAEIGDNEKILLDEFFKTKDKVKVSDLRNKLVDIVSDIKKNATKDAAERGWIASGALNRSTSMVSLGLVVAIFSIWAIVAFPFLSISGIISGAIVAFFGLLMPKLNQKGVDMLFRIRGIERYMRQAEDYRQQFYEKENIFDKLLPYAIIFGIADLWADKMRQIYGEDYVAKNQSVWYIAHGSGGFNLNTFSNQVTTITSRNISSSHYGSSGFSGGGGGGFSGGGGGGGGGGGW